MRFSSLSNFKKATTIATACMVVTCLIPKSIQAAVSIGDYSGDSGNTSEFVFDLFTVEEDDSTKDKPDEGLFLGAIQNFKITKSVRGLPAIRNKAFCGNPNICSSGDVKVTKLATDSSGNILGLDFGLDRLQKILDDSKKFGLGSSNIDVSQDVLRYDITFDGGKSPDPDLIWFIQSNDSELINNLSGLSQFNKIYGLYRNDVSPEEDGNTGGIFRISRPVPEPTATASLLGLGILGAATLLKCKKYLKTSEEDY